MRNSLLTTLIDMHSYMRPAGSRTEREFIDTYLAPIPSIYRDPWGNWRVTIGDVPVLWSCHTDTVHWTEGRQTTHYDDATGILSLSKRAKRKSSCLGADDTAGVFIMCEMIRRNVPGTYIFHYGEEQGCIGSHDLAECDRDWLGQFDMAIALDRGGCHDVITHQIGSRSASDTFALSIGHALSAIDPTLVLTTAHGVYTDTAQYTEIINECTNLSVGYSGAHSRSEKLNCWYVLRLLEALCRLDTSQLVIDRDPDYEALLSNVCLDLDDGPDANGDQDDSAWKYLPEAEVWDCDEEGRPFDDDYYLDPAYREVQVYLRKQSASWRN